MRKELEVMIWRFIESTQQITRPPARLAAGKNGTLESQEMRECERCVEKKKFLAHIGIELKVCENEQAFS